jgi:RimJ/RimL family protein N-acetyltransferase
MVQRGQLRVTDRLRLVPIAPTHAEEWYRTIWSDPDVTRYLPPQQPIAREQVDERIGRAASHWDRHGFGIWVVEEASSGDVLGHTGLVVNEPPDVELIYALGRHAWGHGFATEAASSVVAHAFRDLALEELAALVFPANTTSIRVLEKLGFDHAGETNRFDAELLRYRLTRGST